ncbi:TaqI-like C-terminal specificity domain-containing protein [Natronococcus sp. A-GB1]|uniref:Eco57I restriction-modification methylase domain-containing protein n=1 Tax=Natronococcus sp. A-GB1 TaxID=3037648 RepID=UPI00241E37EC|nr:TaqI-like C-terminal specificity domain-containing protein [Natronococcus sp. A-GB1]MDG5761899.1 TaqI-like C-terminal specificity domain-containing protein [Natronococcus sp. A-GB1]
MQTALTYRTNRDLFSNYYLDEHLPETEEWDEVSEKELREAYDDIMDLWEREKNTAPKRNESQLEEKFIRPMFRKLGIPFEVEESTSRTQRRPDYGFFETEEAARDAFERREEGGDFYENSVAVADAKRWGRPLDTRGSGEHERDFENPSYQIHVYLQETPARWAVLTDGKKWRLYYGPTSHRLDSYYEVDLPTILENGGLEDFKYFYLFFRHEAFLEDASGDCFLDDVYGESNVFAQELGEDLQDNIYEAIKILSEGFLQFPENDLDEDDLGLIHDSSLIYLYRLIFVLYAEAEGRELLDTSNEIYEQSYSLNNLKQEVAEEIDSGNPSYRDWQDDLWDQLDELFMLIDQGSKSRGIPEDDLYIPAYNGGLFRTNPDEDDSPEAQFLAEHKAGDAYLAKVVELLTRSKNGNGGGKIFVDYSSLDVRHLGSIYEGLLEYQLNVADEPLALNDGEYVIPDEGDEIVVEAGEVYLTTGSGERKATGSYYTPEYVVQYIVEETLGPLVEDIRMDLAGRSAYDEGGFAAEFADRVFELKILDPAMGSGHFLTSAIDYLAREIIDAQEKQAAQQGIETVNQEHDINWARRQVAQRCIYGVDLNPLAVELAKVSLWLRTLAAEQPLAFLDHHLKTGNSLVGSDIEEIEELESEGGGDGQNASLADFGVARKGTIEQLMRIYEDFIAIENQELADVKEMESKYDEIERNQLRQRLEAMANVRTARDFGLDHAPEDIFEDMAAALEDDAEWEEIASEEWFEDAQTWAEDQDYFHWKLEFPEVFYTADGDSKAEEGFDAVIGNPPYIIFQMLSDDIRDYYRSNFVTFEMKGDVYVLFLELASDLLREHGHTGYIIQNKFTKAKYGSSIRNYLSSQETVREIIDFHDSPVFDITAYPMILLRQKVPPGEDHKFTWRDIRESEKKQIEIELSESEAGWTITQSDLKSDVWHPFVSDDVVTANTIPIEEFADQIGQGAIPGNTEVYIVDDETVEENDLEREYIEQVLRGGDVNQFIMESPQNLSQLIYPYDVVDGEPELATPEQIPNILSYLEKFKSDLVERKNYGKKLVDQGYEWYELRYEAPGMLNEKIVFPDISPENRFAYDQNGEFACLDTVYYLVRGDSLTTYDSRYLTAILNSALLDYLFDRMSPKVRGGYRRYKTQYVESLPVPAVDFTARRHINDNADVLIQKICKDVSVGNMSVKEAFEELYSLGEQKVILHDTLCSISDLISDIKHQRRSYNLELMDYLGSYNDGEKLEEFSGYQPASGVSESLLSETTETKDNLRFGDVRVAEEGHKVVIEASARYKPENPEEFETDRWGYTETEYNPVIEFVGVDELETALLVEFVEYATEEGDGFAGFRDTATKRNSLVDRLEDLVLPDIYDIESGLETYLKKKREVSELDDEYNRLYDFLNRLVYELYELDEDKIRMVESTR